MGKLRLLAALGCAAASVWAQSQGARANAVRQLPDGTGKDVTQRVCGSTCHGAEMLMGDGRSRSQWTAVVNQMVARGAKATDAELVMMVNYLSEHLGPGSSSVAARPRPGAVGRGPGPLGAGAADSHVVDEKAAERGKTLYIAECITCHGPKARGGDDALPPPQRGADLVRSLLVLHDRYGNEIGRFLAKGHPLQSKRPSTSLTKEQIVDISHFLHQKVYYTLRTGPELKVQDILTGDAKAGKAYFEGEGKCGACHSASGDLAGIGKRYDPVTIQQKFLFPRMVGFGRGGAAGKTSPVTVSVTDAGGTTVKGVLLHLDDFNVALRDDQGAYHSFKIAPAIKVVKHDPYVKHVEMLDQYTDKNIHDVVAYLESLK